MYGYLFFTGMLAGLWGLIWITRKDLRRKLHVSSIASTPLGLANPMFIPEYWDPVVIYRAFGIFDIESVFFSFFIGGVAATIYYAITGASLPRAKPILPPHHAGIAVSVVVLTVVSLAYVKHNGPVPAIVMLHLGVLSGIAYAWRVRPDLIRVSVASGALFPAIYLVLLLVTETVIPSFLQTQWSGYATFNLYPFGIPLDEFIYAALFAAAWSVVYETGSSITRGFSLPTSSRDYTGGRKP